MNTNRDATDSTAPRSTDRDPAPETEAEAEATSARISQALDRLERAVVQRPGFGRTTKVSKTVVVEGLRCRSEESGHVIESDLPPALGGASGGPTPGMLMRAAVGSCLAMVYRLRAARRGVDVRTICVTIETDSEIAGLVDPESASPAGFSEIRYRVDIRSNASRADIEAVLDEGDRLSPMLDVLRRSNRLRRTITIEAEH